MKNESITCAILAGGANSRFGKNKLLLEYQGKSFMELTVDKLAGISDDIVIAGGKFSPLKNSIGRCHEDSYDLKASIVGIHTALKNAKNEAVLIVAGDLPLLKIEILNFLVARFRSLDCEAAIPRVNGFLEPLVAVYSKKTVSVIEENIKNNRLKIVDFIKRIDACEIPEDEIRALDPELLSFFNINTEEDYNRILQIGLPLT